MSRRLVILSCFLADQNSRLTYFSACCSNHNGFLFVIILTLTMAVTYSSETLVSFQRTTWNYISKTEISITTASRTDACALNLETSFFSSKLTSFIGLHYFRREDHGMPLLGYIVVSHVRNT